MPTRNTVQIPNGHLPVLDGWRGLAILVVVMHNTGESVLKEDGSLAVTLTLLAIEAGWMGVTLFFVLSGFLITRILVDTADRRDYLRNFYVRRTLRIFPLYYSTLFTAFVLLPPILPDSWRVIADQQQLFYWLYISNWIYGEPALPGLSHFWSLAVEEQFYLFWPFLLLLTGRRFPFAVGVFIVMPLIVRICMLATGLPSSIPYENTLARCDALAIGALLAIISRHPVWYSRVWTQRRRLLALAILAFVTIVILARNFGTWHPLVSTVGHSVIGLLFGLLLLLTMAPHGKGEILFSSLVSIPLLRFLGKYSYGIYVLHYPVDTLLSGWAEGWVNQKDAVTRIFMSAAYQFGVLVAAVILAVVSFHLMEKHFLSLKTRWTMKD